MDFLLYVALSIIFLRIFLLIYGSLKTRKKSILNLNKIYQPFVSIIIPARNEEKNIEKAITSVLKSNYPKDLYEIIAVNDRSEDKTAEILSNLAKNYSNLKILNVTEVSNNPNLKGKAGALHNGILYAKGEIILMTDADCQVDPNWIRETVYRFSDTNIKMVSSYTIIEGNRIFDKLQAIQWIYLQKMASSGPAYKYPLGCFGTNLSIRKDTYFEIGGYENIEFSVTEDYALLKAVMKSGYQVSYITNPNAIVHTKSCQTFQELISQLRRWAKGGLDLKWIAAFFVLSSLSVWFGLISSIILNNYLFFILFFLIKFGGDFILITESLLILKQNKLIKWVLPSLLFFMIMEILIPPLMINTKINWKGQYFK